MLDEQRLTGRMLNGLWNVGARHALYHKYGNWYHILKQFPGALFDPNGYVRFETQEDFDRYNDLGYLKIGEEVHVPGGISNIPGYKRKQ